VPQWYLSPVRHPARTSLDTAAVERLYRRCAAAKWSVSIERFGEALAASAERAFKAPGAGGRDVERYLGALHLEDLALACACADGHEAAWDHFVREFRPILYRAAGSLAPDGSAREIADSLYADLYGLQERDGVRRSLFAYYHGRSSLATWLRAVLSQRLVDRARAQRKIDPLPDEPAIAAAPDGAPDPDAARYLDAVRRAFLIAIAALAARDRLRLACYYAQQLTLAEVGRLLGEHEATVSRQLARTRRTIRDDVERRLRVECGFSAEQIAVGFELAAEEPGALDLSRLLTAESHRKDPAPDRSLDEA
jgi:RNA polymerase sigma-70 factor, ECF subfamily